MRPYTIPQKLKPLTEAQFDQLHTWLDDLTYDKVRERLKAEFGIDMSDSALCRYNQTRDLARHIIEKGEDATAVRDFLAIMNGQPVPYGEAGIELVMKRAFDLAAAREMTPARLATLLRVFHYKTNCQWNERRHAQNERRLAQNDQRIEISDRLAKVREEELSLKKSRSETRSTLPSPGSQLCDELGPIATTVEELQARTRRAFGHKPPNSFPGSTGSDAGADSTVLGRTGERAPAVHSTCSSVSSSVAAGAPPADRSVAASRQSAPFETSTLTPRKAPDLSR